MKHIYKTSTQITILLVIIILTSFFWWQIKFSTKKIKIDLEDSIYKPDLNIEGAKYSGFLENGQLDLPRMVIGHVISKLSPLGGSNVPLSSLIFDFIL